MPLGRGRMAVAPWKDHRCQASCTSQRNQKFELMERTSTIHLYTLTPPLTCDGRRESQHAKGATAILQ
jgi:hypothetical protein